MRGGELTGISNINELKLQLGSGIESQEEKAWEMERPGTDTRLESKLGFDRIRSMISDKCSTEYAVGRVADEVFSTDAKEISKRLALTDEMRLVMMFEESFPTNGYIDCLPFLKPLENTGYNIDLLSLGKLRTMVETVRRLTNFFLATKDGVYPNLKRFSAPVKNYPEVQRRIDLILDKYGDVKDTASDALLQIRRSLKSKEGSISKKANAILKQAQLDGIADADTGLAVRDGKLTPVFFGSALTNFGVEPFLEQFLKLTTSPLSRETVSEKVDPMSEDFSAFVFKIQANMNKAHRDRIAFMRICSGKFEKNMEVFHVQGNKKMRLSQPQQIMAQEREIVEEAYAGDIIGVFDPGIFSIGDTICSANHKVQFKGIPTFAPEHFMRVRQKDTMKRKQFIKGTSQIAQEGAIQIFQELDAGMEEVIVGVVGVLQFDVLKYRLENEYNVDIIMESLPYEYIRWIVNDDIDPKTLDLASDTKRIQDLKGNRLLLFTSYWSIDWALDHNKGLELREFGTN